MVYVTVMNDGLGNSVNATIKHKQTHRSVECQIQQICPFAVDSEPVYVGNVSFLEIVFSNVC